MPLRRKTKQEKAAGAPAWTATFSDLATLLLTFFILLYSFSILDIQKFQSFVASFRGVGLLESGVTPIQKDPKDTEQDDPGSKQVLEDTEETVDPAIIDRELMEIYNVIKQYLDENNLESDVSLRYETRGIVLQIKDKVFFDSGKTEIKPESRAFLDRLAELFKNLPNEVSIEGHTDNVPTNPQQHATNWELSVDRAAKVVRYFTEFKGLEPRKFSAVGYGEWRPIVKNLTPDQKSLNRRVTIVILAKDQYESRVILDNGK